MNLQEYWDLLNSHDWYYNYSDDQRVWSLGNKNDRKLRGIADSSPEHKRLYMGFVNYHFSGKDWNTEKEPKPERPNDSSQS